MRTLYEDPLSGIYLALSGCFGAYGMFIKPDTAIGTIAFVLQAIFIGLFIFRFIRMWKEKEYNPPVLWLPALKLIDAAWDMVQAWAVEVISDNPIKNRIITYFSQPILFIGWDFFYMFVY